MQLPAGGTSPLFTSMGRCGVWTGVGAHPWMLALRLWSMAPLAPRHTVITATCTFWVVVERILK